MNIPYLLAGLAILAGLIIGSLLLMNSNIQFSIEEPLPTNSLFPQQEAATSLVKNKYIKNIGNACSKDTDCPFGSDYYCAIDTQTALALKDSCTRKPNDGSAGTYICPEPLRGQCVEAVSDPLTGYVGWVLNEEGYLARMVGE